jgi:hypothetical protein
MILAIDSLVKEKPPLVPPAFLLEATSMLTLNKEASYSIPMQYLTSKKRALFSHWIVTLKHLVIVNFIIPLGRIRDRGKIMDFGIPD